MAKIQGAVLLSLVATALGTFSLNTMATEDPQCQRAEHPIVASEEIAPWLHVFRAENAVDFSEITFDPRQNELIVGARNFLFRLHSEDLSLIQVGHSL
ncbi:Semaphorin-5A [Varanus komodoensis]|nr:Semaphorin-5A [Varanus komodoensis]